MKIRSGTPIRCPAYEIVLIRGVNESDSRPIQIWGSNSEQRFSEGAVKICTYAWPVLGSLGSHIRYATVLSLTEHICARGIGRKAPSVTTCSVLK